MPKVEAYKLLMSYTSAWGLPVLWQGLSQQLRSSAMSRNLVLAPDRWND